MSTILPALRDRRFLLTAWPWRSLAYLATGVVVAAPIALVTWMLALPWIATVTGLQEGRPPKPAVVFLMVLSLFVVVVFGPLVAIPLAALERWRLALADERPIATAHTPAPAGSGWLPIRYAEAATWKEVLYGLLFTLAGPIVYFFLGLALILIAGFIISPALAGTGTVDFQLGPFDVRGTGPALLLCALGLALVVPMSYVIALTAAGQATLARHLLGNPGRAAFPPPVAPLAPVVPEPAVAPGSPAAPESPADIGSPPRA